jgi:DNA replication protein DnaC
MNGVPEKLLEVAWIAKAVLKAKAEWARIQLEDCPTCQHPQVAKNCLYATDARCPRRSQVITFETREKRRRRLEKAGVPASYWVALLGETPVRETEAVRAARALIDDGLVLRGDTGRGKTLAACVALAELGGFFLDVPSLAWAAKEDVEARLKSWQAAPLLVLDELGDETQIWVGQLVRTLVRTRLSERRPVVITTRLSDQALEERYGEHLTHRVRVIELVGGDLRVLQHSLPLTGAAS